MKKLTYLAFSMVLVCLLHVSASAQVIMPTWSYTFNHTLVDLDSNEELDIKPQNVGRYKWLRLLEDNGTFDDDYFATNFDFRKVDTDYASLTSNLTMSADGYDDMNFTLNLIIASTNYGEDYFLTVDSLSSTLTDSFTFDSKKYNIVFGLSGLEKDNKGNEIFKNGQLDYITVDGDKKFKLEYRLEIAAVSTIAVDNPPAPTPEPATLLLTGLGLAGMGLARKRKKKV